MIRYGFVKIYLEWIPATIACAVLAGIHWSSPEGHAIAGGWTVAAMFVFLHIFHIDNEKDQKQ